MAAIRRRARTPAQPVSRSTSPDTGFQTTTSPGLGGFGRLLFSRGGGFGDEPSLRFVFLGFGAGRSYNGGSAVGRTLSCSGFQSCAAEWHNIVK